MNYDDVTRLFDRHKWRGRWLKYADELLATDDADKLFHSSAPHECGDLNFSINIPAEIWKPQLRAKAERMRREVTMMDATLREYVAAASRGETVSA